ncbi:protein kinase domain-containing protein [Thermocatellispora tengchongensis]
MHQEQVMIAGRYRLIDPIGAGGVAEVWRGVDTRLDMPVAVKLVNSLTGGLASAERFAREARAAAQIIHPNVVTVLDVGQDAQRRFLVMELLSGRSLAAELADRGTLGVAEVCRLLAQAAAGLAAAHRARVVHRDIKPANLHLTDEGTLKVVDFGLAHLASEAARLTTAGTTVGTAAYLAPEQINGSGAQAASDLYALGCVAYELLCGHPPFTASPPELIDQHLYEPVVPPIRHRADIPAELNHLILALLAKDPAQRPADAEHVQHLLAVLANRTRTSPRPTPAPHLTIPAAPHPSVPAPVPHPGAPASVPHPGAPASVPHPSVPASVPHPSVPASVPHPSAPAPVPHVSAPAPAPHPTPASPPAPPTPPDPRTQGSPPPTPAPPVSMPTPPASMPGAPASLSGAPVSMPGAPASMPGAPASMPGAPASTPRAPLSAPLAPPLGSATAPGAAAFAAPPTTPGARSWSSTPAASPSASAPPFDRGPVAAGHTAVLPAPPTESAVPPGSAGSSLSHRRLLVQVALAVAVLALTTVGAIVVFSRPEPAPRPPAATAPTDTPTSAPATPPTTTPTPSRSAPTPTPPPTARPTPSATPPNLTDPRVWLLALDSAVTAQQRTGGIAPDVAAKAHEKIRDAAEKLAKGEASEAGKKIRELTRDLSHARREGKLTDGPLTAFLANSGLR